VYSPKGTRGGAAYHYQADTLVRGGERALPCPVCEGVLGLPSSPRGKACGSATATMAAAPPQAAPRHVIVMSRRRRRHHAPSPHGGYIKVSYPGGRKVEASVQHPPFPPRKV
jgi:hypothetical protein